MLHGKAWDAFSKDIYLCGILHRINGWGKGFLLGSFLKINAVRKGEDILIRVDRKGSKGNKDIDDKLENA